MGETELGEKLSWGAEGRWYREGLRDGVRERLCPVSGQKMREGKASCM